MKTKYIYIVIIALLAGTFVGCSDWTEPTGKNFFETPSDEYYANLRAYKNTDHQIAFGWFGGWTGKGASMVSSLMGLPDSVDFVSIWGNWKNLDEARLEDKRMVKELKGTRALMCFIVANVGDQLTPQEVRDSFEVDGFESPEAAVKNYWGWVDGNDDAIKAAIEKYANAICDTIDKYEYDGFDIDYEPNWGAPGNIAGGPGYDNRMDIFVTAMRNRLGNNRLLVVDGEPQSMPAETGPLFDYFIVQAYDSPGYYDLDRRLQKTIDNYEGVLTPEEVAKKYVVTENFEDHAAKGGTDFTDRFGNKMKSLAGMAGWNPIVNEKMVPKGGCGTYHMEYDYINQDACHQEYKFLRQAISIMNPTIK